MTTEPLTLPGSIPRLLRRGSPVTYNGGAWLVVAMGEWDNGDEGVQIARIGEHTVCPIDFTALDLSDPTGRAHAAWWLLQNPGFAGRILSMSPLGVSAWWWYRSGVYMHAVTADLDPDDSRLLPDGSRWVDAEALRRVVLHVAGREVPA